MAKRWRIQAFDQGRVADLAHAARVPSVVAQLLISRGVCDAMIARQFLEAKAHGTPRPQRIARADACRGADLPGDPTAAADYGLRRLRCGRDHRNRNPGAVSPQSQRVGRFLRPQPVGGRLRGEWPGTSIARGARYSAGRHGRLWNRQPGGSGTGERAGPGSDRDRSSSAGGHVAVGDRHCAPGTCRTIRMPFLVCAVPVWPGRLPGNFVVSPAVAPRCGIVFANSS